MKPRIRIVSCFSIPTDLAGAMRDWPEFVRGSDYDVDLRSPEEKGRSNRHSAMPLISPESPMISPLNMALYFIRLCKATARQEETVPPPGGRA